MMSTDLEDLCRRQSEDWLQGSPRSIEEYLAELSDAPADPELVVDLIYNEILHREALGETIDLEAHCRRFPEHETALRRQWQLHEILGSQLAAPIDTSIDRTTDERTVPFGENGAENEHPHIPGYEIKEVLGQGGTGIVYRAHQASLNREVALKMLSPWKFPDLTGLTSCGIADRIREEAQLLAGLEDAHIVRVIELGEWNGRAYFVMELAHQSLADRLREAKNQPLPPMEMARLVETLAHSLEEIHKRKTIHRDLKPANILLNKKGEPKLGDFGLAKALETDQEGREHSSPVGTPAYMAPEQISEDKQPLDHRVDIYGLGAVLYEGLTGEPPYLAKSREEVYAKIRTEPVPFPRKQRREIPRQLEALCRKCLSKDPKDRYRSAAELAKDLHRIRHGRPVPSLESNPVRRLGLLLGSYPARTGVVLMYLIAVGALLGLTPTLDPNYSRAEAERELRGDGSIRADSTTDAPGPFRALQGPITALKKHPDGTFTIDTTSVSLIEWMEDPQWEEYRFTAEVRHDQGSGISKVGIFFGCRGQEVPEVTPRPVKSQRSFYLFTFAGKGSLARMKRNPTDGQYRSEVLLEACFLEEDFTGAVRTPMRPLAKSTAFQPTPKLQEPDHWRTLILEVRKQSVKVFWVNAGGEKQLVAEGSHEVMSSKLDRLKLANPSSQHFQTTFQPRTSLGLFVKQGKVTFRALHLERLTANGS